MPYPVILKPKRARPFFGRHPWLFEKAIDRIEGVPAPGDEVEVRTDRGEFVAYGLFNPASKIRARLYSWHSEHRITEDLIAQRLREAIAFRQEVLGLVTPRSACRLVYSESDGLSGLVIDRFADVVSVQINSRALEKFVPTILGVLQETLSPRAIYGRIDPQVAEWEKLTLQEGIWAGTESGAPVVFEESGVEFVVDPKHGQKTGAYLDQRENRRAAAALAPGRDVLDVFCYAGGFGLVAAKTGEAKSVTFVDSSPEAQKWTEQNAERNGVPFTFIAGDAGRVMNDLARDGRRFGMVLCDPPKFAAKGVDVEGALRGYEYINRSALALVEPGGILVTSSCSGLVTPADFLGMLAEAALRAKRELRLLEVRGQAPDHPVSLSCPETSYLKCVIARVMD